MTCLIDKFGIISNTQFTTKYKKSNYIENYLNDNFICHHDLIKNKSISMNDLTVILKNYLRKHKTSFSRMIRFGKISINNIIDFINETQNKFDFICSICDDFPNEKEMIVNIILLNPSMDKIISNYIMEKKPLNRLIDIFNKYNKEDEQKKKFYGNLSVYVVENLPIVPRVEFIDEYMVDLSNLNQSLDYYLFMSKKYKYFEDSTFDNLITIIQQNIGNCIIKYNSEFLIYLQNNNSKINSLLNSVSNNQSKKDIQESILFFRPINFLELYTFMNILVELDIDNKEIIIDKFIQINKKLINDENIKFVTHKINNNIINKVSNENNYKFIKNIKYNQDLIVAYMTKMLMKRYIYSESFDRDYEDKEYKKIKSIFPNNVLYKYHKVILDIINSKHNMKYMKYKKLDTIPISKSIWDLDYSVGYYEFRQSDIEYTQYHLHLGEIVTEFKTNKGNYNIRMLPIHYEIIYNPNDFKNNALRNYDKEYTDNIFQQLLDNNILEMCNKTPNGYFQINKDYDGGDLDLIEMLQHNSITNDIENDIDTIIQKEISLDRQEIIMSNVNSILKTYQTDDPSYYISKELVFTQVNSVLESYFDITMELFDKVIKEMADKEYIEINEESGVKKLIYI